MKANIKSFLLNLFGSLFSNARAIDGARTSPFFVAIIMFLIGNFFPVIPIMVATGSAKGSDFLSRYTYGVEVALAQQTNEISKLYDFKVNDNNELLAYNKDGTLKSDADEEQPLVEQYVNSNTNNIDLQVYYLNRVPKSKDASVKTVSTFVQYLSDKTYKSGTTTEYAKTSKDDETKVYKPSYLILYPQGLVMAIYKDNSTNAGATSYTGCNWKSFEKNTDVISILANVKDSKGANMTPDVKNSAYVNGVLNNWKDTFNKAFKERKTINFWAQSGMYYGIYLALTLTMGSLLFLLTRGKKNPFNYMKYHTCVAIEGWSVVAPGLLGMIVGFIFTQYAVMAYIMLLGLRTMWLSMKQLRPQYN